MGFSALESCPSCGVAVNDVSAHTRSLRCPHCANWVYFSGNGWAAGGVFEHALDAPSMLRVGRSGKLQERAFVVAGRTRITYDDGFWDEWWLEFQDGDHQWLEEDEGSYRLHVAMQPDPVPDSKALMAAKVGSSVSIGNDNWFVAEKIEARVSATEGTLPVAIVPGEQLVCIDVIGSGTKMSLEASGRDVTISQSEVLSASRIEWN